MNHQMTQFCIATKEQAKLLRDFAEQTFVDTYKEHNQPEFIKQYIQKWFTIEKICSEISDPQTVFILAYKHNQLVGYAKLVISDRPECLVSHAAIEIERFYVATNQKRLGIGSTLIQHCFEEASKKRCSHLWLGVWENNKDAQQFYKHWQFETIGQHDFFMGEEKQTDVIMIRPVPNPESSTKER